MRKLKLLIAFGSILLLVFVSRQTKCKSNNTTEEKVKVVVIMDDEVQIIRDISLYRSSSDVEKMAKIFPEKSRFYEGSITNLSPGKDLTNLILEIYADGQFIPGDMFIPTDEFLSGDLYKSFKNEIVISGSIMEKLTGERSKGLSIKSIEKMKVNRSDRVVKVSIIKAVDQS